MKIQNIQQNISIRYAVWINYHYHCKSLLVSLGRRSPVPLKIKLCFYKRYPTSLHACTRAWMLQHCNVFWIIIHCENQPAICAVNAVPVMFAVILPYPTEIYLGSPDSHWLDRTAPQLQVVYAVHHMSDWRAFAHRRSVADLAHWTKH